MADDDLDAELVAEEELFGGGQMPPPPPPAPADPGAMHEQQIRGMIWGSVAGSDAGVSEPGESASNAGDSYAAPGNGNLFFNSRRNLHGQNSSHWGRQQGHAGSVGDSAQDSEDGGDGPHNQGGYAANMAMGPRNECHVRQMPGFRELNGAALLGAGVRMTAPIFRQGLTSATGWVNYARTAIPEGEIVPVRAMCFNIPSECFSLDAKKFTDWQTPMNNSVRAASIAAIIGLVATPLSKGFLSGAHEEIARADDGEEGGGRQGSGTKKPPSRVSWNMFQSEDDASQNLPQVITGYEDIYNGDRDAVVAIRIWHFVFDKTHSTSAIARKLMNESADQSDHSGAAHCPDHIRKPNMVAAAKALRTLIGSSLQTAKLELAAGVCYRHVLNESVYKNLLQHYAGHSDKSPGLSPVDLARLPAGVLNQHLLPAEELGCTHPIGFEWVFNGKRPEALRAGLVHLDGTLMDVDPEQVAVTSYFDISAPANDEDTHAFRVPSWVGSAQNGGKGCFFFQTDPFQRNVFDMTLPHAIAGSIKPGPNLLSLYQERFPTESHGLALTSPALLNKFNNTMTGRDQWIQEQISAMADSIVAFDTFECTDEQRMDHKSAQAALSRGLTSYGQMDGDNHVIEPRQVLKEHAFTTCNVHSKLISPWVADRKAHMVDEEVRLRAADDDKHANTAISDPYFKGLRQERDQFEDTYKEVMRELVELHLSKMGRSFTSKIDKESIPAGYRAVWDGLMEELDDMPNGTANIAFALDMQMTDSDRSLFGHMQNWIGTFFEDDCFVDGRDWRLMQELFYHCFEQFGEQTLLLIFCGPKGNGKTLRTERAMAAFVKGWITMSGPSSTKAGMQGNSDSSNGCNCIYDEMIDELTDGDGSNRTE